MAKDIIEGANPTRMELLSVRKRRALAEKGHKLLSEKRDALVSNFFEVVHKHRELRQKLQQELADAYSSLLKAQMLLGKQDLRMLSLAVPKEVHVDVETSNIMGVRIPVIKTRASPQTLRYSFLDSNGMVDEATAKFRRALETCLRLAEVEAAIRRLAVEIEKTKRRVNALEHIFIPKLRNTERFIEMALDEAEREDFFRRKRIKALLGAG